MYHTPRSAEVVQWFHDTFGPPQQWNGEVLEPVKLKSGYEWADGKHTITGSIEPTPCIWCSEKAYMLYNLRWC